MKGTARAARTTAQHYTWSRIMHGILLPRLRLIACPPNGTKTATHERGKKEAKLQPTTTSQTSILASVKMEPQILNGGKRRAPVEGG